MKVTFTQHGGLAAGLRRQPHVVDSDTLPQTAAEEFARLVAVLKTVPSVEEASPGRGRDAMSYTIRVEDRGRLTVLRQSDITMSPAFATLLQWCERYSVEK